MAERQTARKPQEKSGATVGTQAFGDNARAMLHLYGPFHGQIIWMPTADADTAVAEGWAREAGDLPVDVDEPLSVDESFALHELAAIGVNKLRDAVSGGAPPVGPVLAPPVITSVLTASGVIGTAFTYQIAATNTPTSFGATPLPAGLTVAPTTGIISGTPTAAATTNVGISATNADGTGTDTLVVTVAAAGELLSAQSAGRGKGM